MVILSQEEVEIVWDWLEIAEYHFSGDGEGETRLKERIFNACSPERQTEIILRSLAWEQTDSNPKVIEARNELEKYEEEHPSEDMDAKDRQWCDLFTSWRRTKKRVYIDITGKGILEAGIRRPYNPDWEIKDRLPPAVS